MMKRKWLVPLIAMAMVLTVPFAASAADKAVPPAVAPPAAVTPTVPGTPSVAMTPPAPAVPGMYNYPQTQTKVTAEAAQSAALAKVGGGTVVRTETHYPPHGGMEYKVIIVNSDSKYCVHVSGYDGGITNYHMDQITKAGPGRYQNASTAAISADKAKSIAIQNVGGSGVVTDCNLDYKPHVGALTYHIHVAGGQYEYCLELDASTGAVYKVEPRYKP